MATVVTDVDSRRAKAIELLAEGYSQSHAAKLVGVDRATVKRWLGNEAFASALAAYRKEVSDAARGRLLGCIGRAVHVLISVMTSTDTPPAVRVAAAADLLNRAGCSPQALAALSAAQGAPSIAMTQAEFDARVDELVLAEVERRLAGRRDVQRTEPATREH